MVNKKGVAPLVMVIVVLAIAVIVWGFVNDGEDVGGNGGLANFGPEGGGNPGGRGGGSGEGLAGADDDECQDDADGKDDDCPPFAPYCVEDPRNAGEKICAECEDHDDCVPSFPGDVNFCTKYDKICVFSCSSNSDCDPQKPHCLIAPGLEFPNECVAGCNDDDDCQIDIIGFACNLDSPGDWYLIDNRDDRPDWYTNPPWADFHKDADPKGGACVECTDDSFCANSNRFPGKPACNGYITNRNPSFNDRYVTFTCVECRHDRHCYDRTDGRHRCNTVPETGGFLTCGKT